MGGTVPHVFLRSQEQALASYNYTDLAEGTGVVRYYLAKLATSGGSSYALTQNTLYSSGATTSTGSTTTIDAFEVTFNLPKVIKGTAIANILYGFTVSSGGAGNMTITVTLEKESGGSDSTIATAISDTRTSGTGGSFSYSQVAIPLTCAKTHFKKGDKLKLTVTGTISSGTGPTLLIMHDPSNARGPDTGATDDFTDSALYVPFVIDL